MGKRSKNRSKRLYGGGDSDGSGNAGDGSGNAGDGPATGLPSANPNNPANMTGYNRKPVENVNEQQKQIERNQADKANLAKIVELLSKNSGSPNAISPELITYMGKRQAIDIENYLYNQNLTVKAPYYKAIQDYSDRQFRNSIQVRNVILSNKWFLLYALSFILTFLIIILRLRRIDPLTGKTQKIEQDDIYNFINYIILYILFGVILYCVLSLHNIINHITEIADINTVSAFGDIDEHNRKNIITKLMGYLKDSPEQIYSKSTIPIMFKVPHKKIQEAFSNTYCQRLIKGFVGIVLLFCIIGLIITYDKNRQNYNEWKKGKPAEVGEDESEDRS